MRHRIDKRKLGRTTEHRIALLRNLATSLFEKERIITTLAKAKELRRFSEKAITLAKEGSLHSRRLALKYIWKKGTLKKLFEEIGPRFEGRNGGYTRIVKLEERKGDGAQLAIVELVGSEYKKKEKKEKKKKA
ncbi:MAG: 50S ribosomal protein L17 [Candidatus Aminicenantia bacterium]